MVHQGGGVKQEEGGDDEGREEPEASPEEEDGLKQVQQDLVSTRSTPSQKASIDSSTQQSSFAFHDAVEPHSFEDSRREYFHKTNNRLDPFLLLPPSSSPTPGNVDSEKPHLSLLVPDETAQTPFAPHLPHQRSRDVQQEQQKDGEESGGEGQERGVNAKAKQVFLFPDFGLDSSLLMSLDKTGLKVPSPVQVSAIPRALQGKNLLVQAKSGTGKTVAFSLSLLQRLIWRYQSDCLRQTNLSSSSSSSGLLSASLKRPDDEKEKKRTTFGVAMALVLAPTRELAVQIANEVHRLAWFMREPPLRYACLFGGSPLSICQEKLKHQPHILIATPGRLLSLLRNKQTQRVLGTWTCDCLSFHQELLKREKGKKEDASSKKQTFYGEKPSTDLLLEARGHLVEEHNEEKEAGEEEQEKGEKKGEKEEEDEEAMNTNASENREEEGRQSEDDGEEEEEEEKQQGAQKRVKDREEKEGEQREEKRDETRSEKKEDETEEKQERENLVGKGKEEGINKIEQEEDKEKNKKNSKKNEKNKKGEDILFCRPCRRLPSSRRLQRHLEIIVLDEADLLLDHFFRHQVQALLKSLLHPHMQLLAFSATFPPPLISFLENFVEDLDEARYTSALQSQKKKEEEEQRQRALSFVVAHALAEKEGGGLSLKGEKEGSFSLTKELAEAYMNRARNFEKEGRDSNEKRKKENCKEDTHGEERKRREEEVREEEEEIEGESSISKKRVEGKDTGEEGSIREGVQKRHSQEGKKREGEEGEEEEEENITEVQEKVVSSGVVGVVGEEQMIRERHEETHSSRDLREKNGSLNSPFVSSSCFRSEESHRGEKRENNGAEKVDASHALETGKQTKASAPRGREVGSMIPMRSEPRCFEKILLCSSWILHSREGKTSLHKREEENKKTEINGSEVVRKGEEEEETKVDGREGSSLKKASMGKKRSAAEVARALAMKYGTPSSPSPPPPLSSLSSSSSSLSFSSSSSSSSSTSTHRISFSSEAHPLSSVSPSLSSQLQPLSFSSSCASLSPSSSGPREMKSETNDRKREEDSMKDQSPGSSGDMSSPPKKALEMLEERKDMRGRDTSSSFIGSSKEEEEKKKSLEGGESLRERKECLVSSSSSPPSSSLCSISFPSQQNREGSIAEAEELDREPLSHVDRPSDKKSSPSGDLAFSAKTTNPDDRLDTSDFYSTQKQEDRQTLALSSPSLSSSTPSSSSSSLRPSLPSPLLEGIYYALLIVPDEPTVMRQLGAKVRVLLQVFSSLAFRQAIVFCNDQESGAQVAMCLNQLGVSALYTSGRLRQADRVRALLALKKVERRVLVCSDVISRGIDAVAVDLAVNLDLPMDRQTFLHRSGRAGRFGGEGFCVSISSEDEKPSFEYLASSFRISLHYSLHDLIHIQQQRQLQMKQIGDADEHGKANETAEEEAKEKEKEEEVKAKEEVKGDRCSMANEGNDERHEVPISLGEEDRTKGILSPIAGSSSSPSSEKHNLPESPSSSLVEGRCSSLEERNPSIPMPVGVKAHEGYRGDTRLNKTEEEEGERRTDRVGDRRGNQDRSLTNGREDKVREFPCVEGPSGEGAYENLLLSPSTQESFKETEVKTNLAEDVSMKDVSLHDERRPKIERDAEIEEKHSSEKAPERGGGVLDGKRRLGVSGEDHKEERKNKEDEDKKKKKKDRQERERKEDVRLHEREEEELREQEEEKKKMKNRQAVHEENSPSPLNYEDVSVLKIPLIGMFISHANLLHSLSSSSSSLCSSSPHLRRSYRQHQGSKEDVQGKNFHRETSLQEGPSFSPSRVSSTSPLLAGEKGDRKEIDNDEEEEEHPYAFFSSPLCSLEFSLLQTIRRDRRRSKERFVMKRKNLEEDTNDKEMRGMRAVASYEEEEGETERDSSGDENSPVSLSSSSFSPESDSMHMAHEESSRFSIKIAAAEQHPPTWSLFSPSSFLLTSPLALSPGLYSPSRKESSPWRFSSSSDTSSSFFTRAHAYRGRFSSPPPPPRVKEEEEDDALSSPTSSSFSSFSIAIRPREVLPVSEALEARRIQERGGREKSELVKEEEQSWSSLSFLLLSFISCEEEMRRGEDHEEDVQSIVRRGGVYTRMRIVRASSLKDLIQRKAIRETGRSSLRRRQPFQGEKRDVNEKKKGVTKVKGKGEEDEEEEKGMEKYMIFAYSKAYEDLMRDALKHIDATSSKQERDHRRLLSDEGRREEDRISEKKKKKGKGVEKDLVKQKNSWRSESTQSRLREGESAGECLGGEREEKIGEGEKATFTVKDNAEKKRDIDPPSREGDSSMEKEGRRHSSRETKDERKNEIKRCEVDQRRKEGRSKRVKRDDGMTSDDRHALWCIFEAACAVKGREEEEEETEERQRKFKAGSNRFAVNGRGAQQREKDKERERRDVHPMKEEDSGWSPTDKRKKNAKQEKKRKENDSESDGETEKEEAVIASVGSSPSSLSHRESRRRSEMKGTPSSVSSFTVKDESPGEGRGEREAYRALVQLKSMHTQFWKNLLVHRLSGRNNS